jgi:diaminopimelate decarboxylase
MTSAELAREVFSIVEKKIASERSSMEFEMAYQMRVAGERIRFAIKAMDTIKEEPVTVDEISLQLLDALDRLERLDRRFQGRSPVCTRCATGVSTEVRA